MLSLKNITITRGANTLLEHVSFNVFEKNVIGLVGMNGCGKSSLLAAITGELELHAGQVDIRKGTRIASLEQEVPASDMTAIDFTLSGEPALFQVYQDLAYAETHDDFELMIKCHERLDVLQGYDAKAKAAKILAGLGFAQQTIDQPIKHFSGGWRMRLSLAKCLFASSDLLLLDEPTNHLDLETVLWLADFIKHYPGAVILISHDRDFLDSVVTHIAHIEQQHCKLYSGDYSHFEMERAQYIALHNAKYKKQQTQISHMMKYVDRFRYKATKAKQAQSRLRAVEKMQMLEPIRDSLPFHFKFLAADQMPNPMLSMKKVDLGYADKTILHYINFNILAGQRIGLLGLNGAGKSTLIKALVGELQPMKGEIERASTINIGYFAQHQVDHMPMEATPLQLLRQIDESRSEKECIQFLGGFAFSRDQTLLPLSKFSGGEKARVALALIVWQRPNLLLMDEPTNHLDLDMRQALTFALQNYQGTMLLVSHDRYLLRTLVDDLYLVESGKVSQFDGSVEDYLACQLV